MRTSWPRSAPRRLIAAAGLALLIHGSRASLPAAPFDALEATIDDVHSALFSGSASCRDVVSAFLARIEAYNPTINAVISLDPAALDAADALDAQLLAAGNVTGSSPLFCVPVLLKDSYDAAGTATTAGCLALAAGARPARRDAPTVAALRAAGAVVLGRANMHELALEGLTASSLGGQTLNPYDLARTPGGSSGGSAAALAASFAVLATGGDTVNSMRSPASANAVFSFRPTRGLVSRAGTVPVSHTQDALGAMARTVSDLAAALNAMASVGFDAEDDVTALAPEEVRGTDYTSGLRGGDASSLRLGLLTGFLNYTASEETTPVNEVIADMVRQLRSAGATVVNVTDEIYDPTAIAKLDIQTYEYREQLDKYLSNANNNNNLAASGRRAPSSFEELYYPSPDTNTDTDTDTSSRQFLVIPSQYAHISNAAARSTSDEAYSELRQEIRHLTDTLHATLDTHRLDALIYPQQRNLVVKVGSPSQSGRNGLMAALTGSPSVLVPAGFSPPTEDAPAGVPVGMELLGPPWSEARLLQIAHLIEQMSPARRVPPFTNRTVESKSYQSVPSIQPRRDNIPDAYPLGQLGTT